MSGSRIFTRDFTLAMTAHFSCSFCYFLLIINMTEFAMNVFGASAAEAGLSAGVYVLGGFLSRVFLGKYIEYVGRRKMLIIALAFGVLTTACYFLIVDILSLLLIRFLHGLAFGVSNTALQSVAASMIPLERKGEGMGYFGLAITLSAALGPGAGMLLSPDYDLIFGMTVAIYSISLLIAIIIRSPEEQLTEEQIREAKSFKLSSLIQFSALPMGIVISVFSLGYSGVMSFLAPFSKEVGLAEAAVYYYVAVSVGTFISRMTTGRIFDRYGPNRIILPAYAVFMAGILSFATSTTLAQLLISGTMLGFGTSVILTVCQTTAILSSPRHRYGTANSTYYAVNDLGSGFGPSILGALLPFLGYRSMFMCCFLTALVSLTLYVTLHGIKYYRGQWRPFEEKI